MKDETTCFSFLLFISANEDRERMASASNSLKRRYIDEIGRQNLKTIHNIYRSKSRFYVELEMAPKTNFSDASSHQKKSNEWTGSKESITMDQLIKPNEDTNIVLIQGGGGVGKTYMMETAALHWAQGKIWKDVNFLFLLKFKELNLFSNRTFEEALTTIYQTVFNVAKFEDLVKFGDKVLFLMDGIDEFSDLKETLDASPYYKDTSVAKGFYKLLKSQYIPGKKLIVTGRTTSCDQIRSTFKELSIKSLNIKGFSSDQVKDYVEIYFSGNKNKSKSLLESIGEQEKLDLMSRTPAFLWSLCELHQQSETFTNIQTVTQLFAWQLTIYLQQHFRFDRKLIAKQNPMDIFDEPKVRNIVKKLSKIAQKSLNTNDLFIDASEVEEKTDQSQLTVEFLERSGFINIVKTPYGKKIQFYHLLMQEFLTAIHFVFLSPIHNIELLNNHVYRGTAPLYTGLKGACLLNSTSPKDLIQFAQKLQICVVDAVNQLSFPYYAAETSDFKLISEVLFLSLIHI